MAELKKIVLGQQAEDKEKEIKEFEYAQVNDLLKADTEPLCAQMSAVSFSQLGFNEVKIESKLENLRKKNI